MDAGPGRVGVSALINYLISMESTELAGGNPMIDYVGTYGPNGNGLNGNSFEWRALTTMTYSMASWDATIRWQHLDGLRETSASSVNTPLPSYDIFDLLGNYRLNDSLSFRFGVENLLYTAPKRLYQYRWNVWWKFQHSASRYGWPLFLAGFKDVFLDKKSG